MRFYTALAMAAAFISVTGTEVKHCQAQTILFSENFDGLELGPVVHEAEPQGGFDFEPDQVWTAEPPPGWTQRVDPDMPGLDDESVGVEEFTGWTFVNAEWWSLTAGDQQRSQFDLADFTTIAVADPDEWDDRGGPAGQGKFNAWLATPPINITGAEANSIEIRFDSTWRTECCDDGDGTNNQTATLTASYDGGDPIELLRWESDGGSDNFRPDDTNEEFSIKLENPADATSLVVEWGLVDAGNDWWWAFDNLEISGIGGAGGVIGVESQLRAGDADQDFDFDQLDLVRVQIGGKYLSGQAATWGEGDWNGAPGGTQGSPPPGDGRFDQLDIIAALNSNVYLTGPYAALTGPGQANDGQTSIIYNPGTGEVAVDAPAGTELTSINIDSAGGVFTGAAATNLGGSFDNDADANIFKATFGGSFGSLSFGNVAQTGLSQDFVLGDLTVVGSLAGGGALGNVDLIYVPEPCGILLLLCGLTIVGSRRLR